MTSNTVPFHRCHSHLALVENWKMIGDVTLVLRSRMAAASMSATIPAAISTTVFVSAVLSAIFGLCTDLVAPRRLRFDKGECMAPRRLRLDKGECMMKARLPLLLVTLLTGSTIGGANAVLEPRRAENITINTFTRMVFIPALDGSAPVL